MILVDADVWIDFFSGVHPGAGAVERLLLEGRAGLSVVSLYELYCGAQRQDQVEQLETLQTTVEPIPLTAQAARRAAEQYRRLRREGRLIGNEDLLLAATALEMGAPIMTRNRQHFERVEGLELIDLGALGAA